MNKLTTAFTLLFCLAECLTAQTSMSILNVNTDQLPRVHVTARLSDGAGRPLSSAPLVSEFTVIENSGPAKTLNAFRNVTDYIHSNPRPVIIAMDISGSMSETVGGRTRLSILLDELRSFVRTFRPSEDSPIAITAFGSRLDTAYSSWTSYRERIGNGFLKTGDDVIAGLNRITIPRGGTNFNAAFFDTYDKYEDSLTIPARLRSLPQGSKPLILFITDGIHAGKDTVHKTRIIDSARAYNAELHALQIFTEEAGTQTLRDIAQGSGGRFYKISSSSELRSALSEFYIPVADSSVITHFEWMSQAVCSNGERDCNALISFRRGAEQLDGNATYTLPVTYIKAFNNGNSSITSSFPGKTEMGKSVGLSFIGTFCNMSNASILVHSVSMENDSADEFVPGLMTPALVQPNNCLPDFTVTFTPKKEGTRSVTLRLNTDCPAEIHISAESVLGTSSAGDDNPGNPDISPNPSDGIFLLKNFGDIKEIAVSDMLGNRVFAAQDFSGERFSLAGYAEGIYILHARLSDGRSIAKKLVLNR